MIFPNILHSSQYLILIPKLKTLAIVPTYYFLARPRWSEQIIAHTTHTRLVEARRWNCRSSDNDNGYNVAEEDCTTLPTPCQCDFFELLRHPGIAIMRIGSSIPMWMVPGWGCEHRQFGYPSSGVPVSCWMTSSNIDHLSRSTQLQSFFFYFI